MSNTCNISPKFRDVRQYASRCTVRHRQPHSNLALMKLSAYYKTRGCEVVLARKPVRIEADKYFASTVFFRASSRKRIDALQALYGDRIEIGGSGIHLGKRLPAEAEARFPDYGL